MMSYKTLNWEAHSSLLRQNDGVFQNIQIMCTVWVMSVKITGVHGFLQNTLRIRHVTKTDTLKTHPEVIDMIIASSIWARV